MFGLGERVWETASEKEEREREREREVSFFAIKFIVLHALILLE